MVWSRASARGAILDKRRRAQLTLLVVELTISPGPVMRRCLAVTLAACLVAFASGRGAAQTALVADPTRPVAELRATGAAFRIASRILGQTRHIAVALPASFAESPPTRRY